LERPRKSDMSIQNDRSTLGTKSSGSSFLTAPKKGRRFTGLNTRAGTVASPARVSLDDTVYSRIKQMILTSQFRPGRKLAHQPIADFLKVSRTPVRQALERLYQEGYVIRIRARGYFVAESDPHEARDFYDVRAALESFALGLTMARGGIGEKQLKRLSELQKTYANHVADNAILDRILSDRDFHLYLASLSGNQYLVDILNSVFERLIMKRRIDGYWSTEKRGAAALKEHEQLLRAIRAGRSSEAKRILESHVREAWVQYEAHLLQLAVP
jgi:GntR family transcriptional regulator, rspAB operon transcriptional repressor